MDILIKLNNQTSGRDKLARLIQYSARSSWYVLQKHKHINHKCIDNLKSLEYHMATFRKLLRFGRFIDYMYVAICNLNDEKHIVTLTTSAAKLAYAGFLLYDHIIWVARIGLIDIDISTWSASANRYWAITISLYIMLDIYEIVRSLKNKKTSDKIIPILIRLINYRKDLLFDIIKNTCDVFIPLSGLGVVRANPGIIGAFGIISSIVGLISLIDPQYRFTIS